MMTHTDISPMRPSHIHFLIDAPGHERLITHLFKKSCPFIETDVVYGVKAPLLAEFRLIPAGGTTPAGHIANQPFWLLEYDFVLQPVSVSVSVAASSEPRSWPWPERRVVRFARRRLATATELGVDDGS